MDPPSPRGPGPQCDPPSPSDPAPQCDAASDWDPSPEGDLARPDDLAPPVASDSGTTSSWLVPSWCDLAILESLKQTPCHGQLLLEGVLLEEASVVHSPILPYVRMVASLIEGEYITLAEL